MPYLRSAILDQAGRLASIVEREPPRATLVLAPRCEVRPAGVGDDLVEFPSATAADGRQAVGRALGDLRSWALSPSWALASSLHTWHWKDGWDPAQEKSHGELDSTASAERRCRGLPPEPARRPGRATATPNSVHRPAGPSFLCPDDPEPRGYGNCAKCTVRARAACMCRPSQSKHGHTPCGART